MRNEKKKGMPYFLANINGTHVFIFYTKNTSQEDRTKLYIDILPLRLVTVKEFNPIVAIRGDDVVVANDV